MIGNPFYDIGIVLAVVGPWIWVALMVVNLTAWKRANPGAPVPLAMFANVAGSLLWAWTAVGAAIELLFLILPASLGLTDTSDAGLSRVLFSWALHAIVAGARRCAASHRAAPVMAVWPPRPGWTGRRRPTCRRSLRPLPPA